MIGDKVAAWKGSFLLSILKWQIVKSNDDIRDQYYKPMFGAIY